MQSIFDNKFLDSIKASLAERKQLFVWHQLSYSGGASDEYIVNSFSDFLSILDTAKTRSRFDIYKWSGELLEGVCDSELLGQALQLLKTQPEITTYRLISGEAHKVKAWAPNDLEELKEWFEENLGREIAVGTERPNQERILAGYFPDSDGIVRPGQY